MATVYATRTDLSQLGLNASTLTQVDTATQDAALTAASALADSYLNAVFTLPLLSYGKDITRAVAQIAAFDLLVTRGYNPDAGSDKVVKDRYDAAIAWLESIAEGEAIPTVVDSTSGGAGVSGVGAAGAIISTAPERNWTGRVAGGDSDDDFWGH